MSDLPTGERPGYTPTLRHYARQWCAENRVAACLISATSTAGLAAVAVSAAVAALNFELNIPSLDKPKPTKYFDEARVTEGPLDVLTRSPARNYPEALVATRDQATGRLAVTASVER